MNKINWKLLAQTPGYKSLKAAYTHDIQKEWQNKAELYKKFRWVIDRAKHHAHHKNISVSTMLDFWEGNRTYWWLNYYQDSNQPKLHSNNNKSTGIKGLRKYYKANTWMQTHIKHRICAFIQEQQQKASTKKKKRWTSYQRKHRRL